MRKVETDLLAPELCAHRPRKKSESLKAVRSGPWWNPAVRNWKFSPT